MGVIHYSTIRAVVPFAPPPHWNIGLSDYRNIALPGYPKVGTKQDLFITTISLWGTLETENPSHSFN